MSRNSRWIGALTLGALGLVLVAGLAYGRVQEQKEKPSSKRQHRMTGRHAGMMSMMRGMMQSCPMMGGMQLAPQMLLMQREDLGLSEDQVNRLRGLRNEAVAQRMVAMDRLMDAGRKLRGALGGEGDEAALKEAAREFGAAHEAMALATGMSWLDALKVLTPEQRTKVRLMQEMMGGMGGTRDMMHMMQSCATRSSG